MNDALYSPDCVARNPLTPTSQSRPPWWAWLLVGSAVLVLLFARSMGRPLDLDEHQFVAPAVLWARQGKLPYADYPYFHTPGLIYVLGPLIALFPYPLLVARLVSVFCGAATVMLLFGAGWRALAWTSLRRRWFLCGGLVLTFVCSGLFAYTNGWSWNHDSAMLCALGAFFLHLRGLRRAQCWWFGLAGALAGLSLDIRLSFAPIAIPLVLVLFAGRSALTLRQRLLGLTLAVGGALLSISPALVLLYRQFEEFRFGILGYARLNTQFYGRLSATAMTLRGKVGYLAVTLLSDPGNLSIFLLALYGLLFAFWKRRVWRSDSWNECLLLMAMLPALLIGVWGPTPTQQQYQYMLLPFLALLGFQALSLESCAGRFPLLIRVLAIGMIATVVSGLPRWYWQVITVPMVDTWVPLRAHRTGTWIRERCAADARVLTIDPIFPLEANVNVYPEYTVGRFVWLVGRLMSVEDRRRHHMVWDQDLQELLEQRPPDAIFCDDRILPMVPSFERYAKEHGFRRLVRVEDSGPTIDRIGEELAPTLQRYLMRKFGGTQLYRDRECKTYTLWVRPREEPRTK